MHTKAAFVISHSRALIEQLLPVQPHYIHLGTDASSAPPTLQDWLKRPIVPRSVEDVLEDGNRRFKLIGAVLAKGKS